MSDYAKELSEKLTYKNKTVYEALSSDVVKKAFDFSEPYKKYLDDAKTEREAVKGSQKRRASFPIHSATSSKRAENITMTTAAKISFSSPSAQSRSKTVSASRRRTSTRPAST